jgi:hypothetical protein
MSAGTAVRRLRRADHLAGGEVEHGSQVKPTFSGWQIRDVCEPSSVRRPMIRFSKRPGPGGPGGALLGAEAENACFKRFGAIGRL